MLSSYGNSIIAHLKDNRLTNSQIWRAYVVWQTPWIVVPPIVIWVGFIGEATYKPDLSTLLNLISSRRRWGAPVHERYRTIY